MSTIDEWLRQNHDITQRPSARIGAVLDDMNARNRLTCCYTVILDAAARERSRQLDDSPQNLPLSGVPVAIKDNVDIMGIATSCGSVVLNRPPAASDAAIVRQLGLAGAIVLGKTNLDEAALGASGRNDHFGRCRNPLGSRLLSGGSSSGSAAAVAAGHALLAVGTDTLGSVRLPAALCGVAGFKPSHGRIDSDGVAPLYPAYDTVGVIAPGIEDLICAAKVLLPTSAEPSAKDPVCTIWVLGESHLAGVDPGISAAYRDRLAAWEACDWIRLRELPAFDFAAVSRAALWEVAGSFARRIGFADAFFDAQRKRLGVELRQLLGRAVTLTADNLDAGRMTLETARTDLMAYVTEAHGIFTPTCPIASIPAAAAVPRTIAQFVAAANVAGLPAVCWPDALRGGKPMSWQLIGRRGEDEQLLRLAADMAKLV